MQKLDGIFDNPDTMERESWTKGRLAGRWPVIRCGNLTQTTPLWERDMLEKPWGPYPPAPRSV